MKKILLEDERNRNLWNECIDFKTETKLVKKHDWLRPQISTSRWVMKTENTYFTSYVVMKHNLYCTILLYDMFCDEHLFKTS